VTSCRAIMGLAAPACLGVHSVAFLTLIQVTAGSPAQSPVPLIKEAAVEVTSVEDRLSYRIYHYRLLNPHRVAAGSPASISTCQPREGPG